MLQPIVMLPSAWRVAAPFTLKLKICSYHRLASILQHGLLDTILFKGLNLPNQAEAVGGSPSSPCCALLQGVKDIVGFHHLHLLLSHLGHVRPALALAALRFLPLFILSLELWISHLTSLNLSFLINKMGIIIRVSTL